VGSNLNLADKRTLRRLADGKGLDLITLYEANAALFGEEYLRFLRTERRTGFRYLRHLKAALAVPHEATNEDLPECFAPAP